MSDAFSYISSEERESLQALPFPVFLPSRVPEGWSAQPGQITVEEEETSYSKSFSKGSDSLFTIILTDSGIGDALPGQSQSEFHHPELDLVLVEHEQDGTFQSDWLSLDGGYLALSGKGTADSELEAWVSELAAL